MSLLVSAFAFAIPSPLHGGEGRTQPPRTAGRWWIAMKFGKAYGASFAQLLAKSLTRSGHITELWRRKRYNLRPTSQGNRIFSHGTCSHWLEWGHHAWFTSAHDQMWLLTLQNDLADPIHTNSANLEVWERVSWGPETEYMANFLRWHVYSASLHYPMSIRVIDPVWH